IVEKETGLGSERPLIAGVFYNRLRLGMPLQSDPTVIYAAPSFAGDLTRADLTRQSPYNTYVTTGLPPGPIANPGIAALDAVLAPTDTPYLYFVSRNDGSHVFSTNIEEHNRNVEKYQRQYFRDKRAAEARK
ncbi:MAG: endolytic transglycosylase MltG, partial [Thermoanaerobaculia bacterium]